MRPVPANQVTSGSLIRTETKGPVCEVKGLSEEKSEVTVKPMNEERLLTISTVIDFPVNGRYPDRDHPQLKTFYVLEPIEVRRVLAGDPSIDQKTWIDQQKPPRIFRGRFVI